MSIVTSDMVRVLREKTGAGIMECKEALTESGGDFEKAVNLLRKKGVISAEKRAGRVTSEGIIGSYIHMGKIGSMVEVNCETDFVARTDDFKELVKDIAMQIAATNPLYISRNDVPLEIIEREKEIYRTQIKDKPQHIIEKIIEGKLDRFYTENCLLEQIFIKDPEQKKKIRDLISEHISRLGENIVIRRFVRFQLGESNKDEKI